MSVLVSRTGRGGLDWPGARMILKSVARLSFLAARFATSASLYRCCRLAASTGLIIILLHHNPDMRCLLVNVTCEGAGVGVVSSCGETALSQTTGTILSPLGWGWGGGGILVGGGVAAGR